MPVHDYIVVGSGCSGAIAAQTLVEAGANVTMLDVGVKQGSNLQVPDKDFITLRKTDQEQYRYFIGKDADGVNWGKLGTGAQITPPRKYIMKLVNRYTPVQSATFSNFESLSYGGMGTGWGLQSWEYTKEDLAAAGLDYSKMKQAYSELARKIGICASDNDATSGIIDSFDNYQPAPQMDRNNSYMYKKYSARKKVFHKRGITLGQTPLALLTKNLGERKKYAYKGMDFYTDNDKSAWRPWITVDQLKKKPNFTYVGGYLVVRFVEKKDITEVHCLEVETNKPVVFQCRTLILACGALGSARIVLRSFKESGKKSSPRLPLLNNAYTYIPCVQPRMVGQEVEPKKLSFAQLSIFLDKDKLKEKASMASLHSYQSLLLFRIVNQVPFNYVDARILTRYLSTGMIILGVYHPDSQSPAKYVQLVPDPDSPTGDTLHVEYSLSADEATEFKRRENTLMKAMRKLGTYPVARINPGFGSGIHYAGTLPFSKEEEPYTLSSAGRLHKTKRVYVADSSGFTYLPSQGLTFSIMANAQVVAKEALMTTKTVASKAGSNAAKSKRIVITGGSGFLGSALIESCLQDGWQVIALVRNAQKYHTPGVTYLEYDLDKPFDESVFAGADYLVHTAYVKSDAQHPDALKTNVDAAKRLVLASRKHKLKRNVFISSMSAHDSAESTYGKQKLAVEKVFSGKDCTVIRSGLIMGDGGMVKQMTDFMKSKHAVPLIGGGKQPLQVIGIYDLVRVIKTILKKNVSGMLTIATPEVYSYKEYYDALRKHLGITVIYVPIPLSLLMGMVKLTTALHLPISINQDNVLGLKNLRSANTADDLRKLDIQLDTLEQVLRKS